MERKRINRLKVVLAEKGMTNYNVEQKDLHGEMSITAEHVQNNRSVRGMLGQRGIKPEELPPAEDIKKVERRVAKDEKSLLKEAKNFQKVNVENSQLKTS